MSRRFPPPWTVRSNQNAFWVEDAEGHQFGFCYFRTDGVAAGPSYLSEDEARRIAANIAKLPELSRR